MIWTKSKTAGQFFQNQADTLAAELRTAITGEVRFDDDTRALAVARQIPKRAHKTL